MQNEYLIYKPGSTEDIAATIFSPGPLSHLAVGNSIRHAEETTTTGAGSHLLIRHVETYFYTPEDDQDSTRARVSIYTTEQDRAEIFGATSHEEN